MEENKKKAVTIDIEAIAKERIEEDKKFPCHIYCCASTGCISSGSESIIDALNTAIENHGIADKVKIVKTGCMGLCAEGPLVRVELEGQKDVLYKRMESVLARLIITEHVKPALEKGSDFTVPEYLNEHILPLDIPFFTKQEKVVLENAGHIDPEDISAYFAKGGYSAFVDVIKNKTPQDVINIIKESGLRGRGGGGFPTGMKWDFASKVVANPEKFIICNGDEGDPGAYMDRSVLEGDPHAVLEGMLIGAYAIGATEGWFYIRAEYPLAIERMQKAIRAAKKHRLLGADIMGSGFNFDCDVRYGAGAFVCGEETALIASIEGKRGTPRPRPPYPTNQGLWNQPSCVNNVETLANIPRIVRKGAKWFSDFGTDKSKGTKVFALTGKVQHCGLIEVPMGMTLNQIVEEIGGGTSTGKALKAVQTGGPSGGVIPRDKLDLEVCYDKLKEVGSIMGSGGMIVMDEDDGMVEIAKFYLEFTVDESCGKCAPCRIGGKQMLEKLEKLVKGKGTKKDLEELKRVANAMKKASLCGLGQTAPNPVLSTMQFFEKEYLDKIVTSDEE